MHPRHCVMIKIGVVVYNIDKYHFGWRMVGHATLFCPRLQSSMRSTSSSTLTYNEELYPRQLIEASSGSWSMPTTNYSYILSYSLNVLLLCNDSFWSHDIYCSVHPGEGTSSVALLKGSDMFPPERVFSISWELFQIRCEVKGQGCLYVQIVKHSEATFVICDNELYKINWI